MLTVAYRTEGNSHELSVKGHCGYKPRGEDIYCAAASILLYTLVETLDREDLSSEPMVVLNSGDAFLAVVAKPEKTEKIDGIFAVIMNGFRLLEREGEKFLKVV